MPNLTTNYNFNKPLVNNATDADIWGDQLNSNWDDLDGLLRNRTNAYNFANYQLDKAQVVDASETAHSLGNIDGDVVLDYEFGHWQYATITGDITSLTINNLPADGQGGWFTLELVQDATGNHTITLGSAFKTAGGAGVTLSTGATARDLLHFTTRDAGATILTRSELDFS